MQILIFLIINIIFNVKILLLHSSMAYGDFSPFPVNYTQAFETFFYAWKDVGLGIYRSVGHTQPLMQGVLLFFFRNDSLLAQKFFILIIPLISFLSFKYYINKIQPKRSAFASFTTSLFYAYSPILMLEFIGGTVYSSILAFALFPLLFGITEDVLDKGSIKRIVTLGLLLGLISSFNAQLIIIYAFSLIVPFIVRLFLNFKATLFGFFRLLPSVLIAFLVDPIFFLSSLKIISTTNNLGQHSNFANSFALFINDIHYTYSWSNMSNALRLGSNYVEGINYTQSTFWTVPFYALLILILIYVNHLFYKSGRGKQIFFVATTFLNFIFLVTFIYLTYRGFTVPIFNLAPPLFLFRNPAKLTLLSTFFFSVLMFCSLNWINQLKYSKRWYLPLLNTFIGAIILLYIWPVFTGDRGLSLSRKDYTIPKNYEKIIEITRRDNYSDTYHNLWIPASYESTSIKLVWLDSKKIETQIGIGQFSDDYYVEQVTNSINHFVSKGKKSELQALFDITQIRNVILLKDKNKNFETTSFYEVKYISKGSSKIASSLSFMPKLYEDSKVVIYRNNSIYPIIYSPSKIVGSALSFQNTISMLNQNLVNGVEAFYLKQQNKQIFDFKNDAGNVKIKYKKINPTQYKIKVENVSGKFPLIFNSSYNLGWMLSTTDKKVIGNHFLANGFANGWLLNADEICRIKSSCTQRKNLKYDIDLILFFAPQDQLILNLYISVLTIISALLLIIFIK